LHKSCYGCHYEIKQKCYWFTIVGQDRAPKAIPKEVMEKGCAKYENTNVEMSELEQHPVMEVFDGEIISDKYKVPSYKRRKKWVKSPHKYNHRKDAQ
tara:strand:- start:197 stop:487 length:291 start_codon:yes stop_codon:yes gene_type:complete